MKLHTTDYISTFIQIADDCPVQTAEIPPQKSDAKSAANIQFDMIAGNPYKFSSDDVIFGVYAVKNNFSERELASEREKFFSKGQPCLRSSPLTKRYGWGIHFDAEGKIALYARESDEYKKFSSDENLRQVKAMRSKRA